MEIATKLGRRISTVWDTNGKSNKEQDTGTSFYEQLNPWSAKTNLNTDSNQKFVSVEMNLKVSFGHRETLWCIYAMKTKSGEMALW